MSAGSPPAPAIQQAQSFQLALFRQSSRILRLQTRIAELETERRENQAAFRHQTAPDPTITSDDMAMLATLKVDRARRRVAVLMTRKFNVIRIKQGHRDFPELASGDLAFWEVRAQQQLAAKAGQQAAATNQATAAKDQPTKKVGKTSLSLAVIEQEPQEHHATLTDVYLAPPSADSKYAARRAERNDLSHHARAAEIQELYEDNQRAKATAGGSGQVLLLTPSDEGFIETFFQEFFNVGLNSVAKDDPRLDTIISDGTQGWEAFRAVWQPKDTARRNLEKREAKQREREEAKKREQEGQGASGS